MEQTWRWYGPKDRISLQQIRQTGATGIVTALHHIPNGEVWPLDDILARKKMIESQGLTWSVVESVPVHEDIKKQKGNFQKYIDNYKQTLSNLGKIGIHTVCYNFMPVLDWSRTDLNFQFEDGSEALKYEQKHFVAFDIFILKRKNASKDYPTEVIKQSEMWYNSLDNNQIQTFIDTIIKGLPGAEESYSVAQLAKVIGEYEGIDRFKLKEHLFYFLEEIIPIAEKANVRMAIHPDDPPWPLMGLPRVVSTRDDVKEILDKVDSVNNGITLCTGSFGAGYFNDLPAMTKEFASRINFAHLRNVSRDEQLNFHEDYFFEGDIDMYSVVRNLVEEENRREKSGRTDKRIPMRPDHGNQMFEDIGKPNNPGYSLYGRMKGLAEIRGLEIGIKKSITT
ncbi:MAG: mannonate dehydratase [Bacteroidales bacterium]|nr:mannonate dehydratase [Bacteroidales bacterium]